MRQRRRRVDACFARKYSEQKSLSRSVQARFVSQLTFCRLTEVNVATNVSAGCAQSACLIVRSSGSPRIRPVAMYTTGCGSTRGLRHLHAPDLQDTLRSFVRQTDSFVLNLRLPHCVQCKSHANDESVAQSCSTCAWLTHDHCASSLILLKARQHADYRALASDCLCEAWSKRIRRTNFPPQKTVSR